MRSSILSILMAVFMLFINSVSGQVLVSMDPQSQPHSSAILDVKSASKGFLPPRLTKCERIAIANPAPGLTVFDTDKGCLYFFDGKIWQPLCGPVDLEKGLMSHYPFNGNVLDTTDRQFHGISFGSPVYTTNYKGEPGKALQFDGINDYVLISDQGGLSTPAFNVSYFYKANETRHMALLSRVKYNDVSNFIWATSMNTQVGTQETFAVVPSSIPCATLGGPAPGDILYSSLVNQPGIWKHMAVSFSNGVQKMYIDGVLIGMSTRNFQNAKNCTATQLAIGSWWTTDKLLFKGAMDDLRIYDRELSEDEINALSGFSCVN